MKRIDISEAQRDLAGVVDAALSGKDVVLTRDGRPVARLVPVADRRRRPQFGSARGLLELAPDFAEPLPDFADYER